MAIYLSEYTIKEILSAQNMQNRDLEPPRTHISEALLDAVAANVSEAKLDS
jgi:hypothetical protein